MILCWMAGGSNHNITVSHGVGKCHVMESVWNTVDLVNFDDDPTLQMKLPSTQAKQLEVAKGFGEKASKKSGFKTCVGVLTACWSGQRNLQIWIKIILTLVLPSFFVEGKRNLVWFYRQYVMTNCNSWIQKFLSQHPPLTIFHFVHQKLSKS